MKSSTAQPIIRIATTAEDRAAAYRLRYELYVEDQGLFGDEADHERRWLCDAYDERSRIVLAEDRGEVVGTARMTFGDETCFSRESREDYDFARFEGVLDESDLSVISRLLVRPAYRGGTLGKRLFHKAFELAALRGSELILGSCELHLINYYWKLGFRPFGRLSNHPTNGALVRIAVVIGDLDHVRALDSPMTSALARRTRSTDAVPRILECIEKDAAVVSERRTGIERFRQEIRARLANRRSDTTGFLDHLDPAETSELLKKSHLLSCDPGDALVLEGHLTRIPYLLISGGLEVRRHGGVRRIFEEPGTLLGEVAFMAKSRRTSEIVAGPEGAYVLALNDGNLRRLLERNDSLAARFLAFVARQLCEKLMAKPGSIRPEAPLPRAVTLRESRAPHSPRATRRVSIDPTDGRPVHRARLSQVASRRGCRTYRRPSNRSTRCHPASRPF